ncbi:MAG TPA: glutamine--tRNA ligase [Candidatus Anaerobiospirillum pullistercoris]|uniref:Glutamine--tRNA ligase n=1 Tax=Candidatus Anaerobiospirillum pullistercoris TaxID=2838452 RepID=A0A9D1WDV4_9GAMM|nr:glutamine--tRNA ligase [Candidatus Anaerobiospirillum pullistercoris]
MEEKIPRNFITDIIDEDLKEGRCDHVATRFPPEPNGYLHIGHAKSICLNFGLARDYQGTCNLRFDDTNPVKEDMEYIESIKRDVQWLGFQWSGEVRHSSDYFDRLYGYAIELIKKGLAYVDELSPDEIREYRGTLKEPGKNSPYRDRSVEENLALFEKMKNGEFAEGKACLRAKIDMASNFICMRDPVIYRVRFAHHAVTGDKWCIYPMYDFTHCISDAIEHISHSICTLEFQDNRRLYDWVLDNITIDCHPHQYEMSRLNLEYSITSKRKLNLLVSEGYVDGWDDPRLTTISGLRRRGYTPASIREFCRRIGVTKQDNTVEMTALESCVREDLNANAPRVMAVMHPLRLVIDNYGEEGVTATSFNVPYFQDKPELGSREVSFSSELFIEEEDFREEANKSYKRLKLGGLVRLRHGYIVKATSCEKDENGKVTCVHVEAIPNSIGCDVEGCKPKGVIHFVDAKNYFDGKVMLYQNLFNDPNPGAAEDFLACVNKDSVEVIEHAALERSLQQAKVGDHFQFERVGYFCVDSKNSQENAPVFNLTVALRETKKEKAQA